MSSFVKKGMGGPPKAANRMRTSAVAASSLGGFLATARDGTDPGINAWVASIKQRGLSAQDAALEVVQKLVPTGGSIDEESAKHAMSQAIAHLYEVDPNADIFNLADDQIANVMAYTVAFDVYNRVQLELGRVFEKLKYAPRVIQERLAQALDYIMVVVNRSMEKVRSGSVQRSMREIASSALQDALTVFSES
ncbi:Qat anti-phage system associated protein QatB [Aquabacterium sp.]|uniref:Qat anti-phage system associated protein QatB n=1 Tax=Aquabacterium sp. TaxID=1872578 RepID=UPI002E33567C|nr:Qat anti-phage system associated protein QatB [Aquabacterium sp.]HEX5313122.1 Qat anti-phage system associated protein QatB [Aquabacterium sp.]